MSNKSVLCVDDSRAIRRYVSEILSPDIHCIEAANGHEALQVLATQRVDLILLDLEMPELNGENTLKEIRLEGITTPVALFTAARQYSRLEELFQLDVIDVLLKPLEAGFMREKIKALLRISDALAPAPPIETEAEGAQTSAPSGKGMRTVGASAQIDANSSSEVAEDTNQAIVRYLVIQQVAKPLSVWPIELDEFIIGRSKMCSLVTPDVTISRKHVRATPLSAGLQLTDLGSQNGIGFAGETVREVIVTSGQQFQIGRFLFTYEEKNEFDTQAHLGDQYTLDGNPAILARVCSDEGDPRSQSTVFLEKEVMKEISNRIRFKQARLVSENHLAAPILLGDYNWTFKRKKWERAKNKPTTGTCGIYFDGDRHIIRSNNSWGAKVHRNNELLEEPQTLKEGDLISIGKLTFQYVL